MEEGKQFVGLGKIVPAHDFGYWRENAPEAWEMTMREVRSGKLSSCGIVRWNVLWARARINGTSRNSLPLTYEEYWGDPGEHGWNVLQAFEYLGVGGKEARELISKK